MATVTSIYRYPVKSFQGETLARVQLGPRGVAGDRAWAVRDEIKGGIRGARRFPGLMRCAARYPEPPPADGVVAADITLPDGTRMPIDDRRAPAALSALLGSEVTVWPLQPADDLEHYRRGANVLDDPVAELRATFGRTEDEPLPDLRSFPRQLVRYESPPGTYFDAFPLLLLSEQSLSTMQGQGDTARFDVRRFRPNLLLDVPGGQPFPELRWAGERLRVGSALLQIEIPCPRCVMTTHGFADLPKDPTVMRHLVKRAGGILGVYASVIEPGEVAVGDALEVAEQQ